MIFSRANSGPRTAFESSAIGITMADLDGHYLAANAVFQNMVGYTEAELQEFSFFDITYEEDREAKLKLVRELVEGRRKHFQIEKRYRRKDGTLLWDATIFLSFRNRETSRHFYLPPWKTSPGGSVRKRSCVKVRCGGRRFLKTARGRFS
jgi:PAS domain S-box-containing protein